MRTSERHERNKRIAQLRHGGLGIRAIATEVGLTERQCLRILKDREAEHPSPATSGASLAGSSLTELILSLEADLDQLAVLARQPAVNVSLGRLVRVEFCRRHAENVLEELQHRGTDSCSRHHEPPPLAEPDMS
jgi:hypothetical protein